MTDSDWITLATAVATLLSVVVAAIAIWLQIRKLNRQSMLQHFADYTKRYQEILFRFPENINFAGLPPESDKQYELIMRPMRAYLDLCFEEWWLNEHRMLEKDVWALWRDGMEAALSKAAFQQAWAKIRTDTQYGEQFQKYIDDLVNKAA